MKYPGPTFDWYYTSGWLRDNVCSGRRKANKIILWSNLKVRDLMVQWYDQTLTKRGDPIGKDEAANLVGSASAATFCKSINIGVTKVVEFQASKSSFHSPGCTYIFWLQTKGQRGSPKTLSSKRIRGSWKEKQLLFQLGLDLQLKQSLLYLTEVKLPNHKSWNLRTPIRGTQEDFGGSWEDCKRLHKRLKTKEG